MTPLTAIIPLRSSTLWGGFRTAAKIPHRYGQVKGEAIQYNATRTLFVWADHAVSNISSVEVGGQEGEAWDWSNTLDSTGKAVAMIRFNQPVDEGAVVVATGVGKLHPRTGAVMDNPATVVWDLLANIAGRDIAESELDDFRDECAALNITVSGTISGDPSVQSVVREICSSIGAVFSANMPGLCKVYPGGQSEVPVFTVDDAVGISANADLASVSNDLTIEFDHSDGSPQQSLQGEAAESIARYGRRTDTHSAPWVSSQRVAFGVVSRMLQLRARRQWAVTTGPAKHRIRVGDHLTLDTDRFPIPGAYMALTKETNFDEDTTSASFVVPVGAPPIITLARTSSVFAPNEYSSVSLVAVGADYILTLREEDGTAMAGAKVTLDGNTTVNTNSAGQARFAANLMTPGEHSLKIVTLDGRTLTSIITI